MLASAVLEVPEHEFDDEDWDDAEELESDEIDVELGEEDLEVGRRRRLLAYGELTARGLRPSPGGP